MKRCELCGRGEIELTRHHLIPRTRHSTKRNKKTFDREEVRTRIAMLCRACHKFAHQVLSEREMEEHYNTVEKLASHPEIEKFVAWVRDEATRA